MIVTITVMSSGCSTFSARQDPFAFVNSADQAYARQDWRSAEDGYRKVITSVPTDAYAYFRLGNVLTHQGRLYEAEMMYRETLIRDAGMTKAYHNLAIVHLLQAESALKAASAKTTSDTEYSRQIQQMLTKVEKITQIPVDGVPSPGKRRQSKSSPTKVKNQ